MINIFCIHNQKIHRLNDTSWFDNAKIVRCVCVWTNFFLYTFATFEKFNSIIICDNVFVHKFDRFKKMCETIDVKLTFLFFYSSNFNSIKTFFVVFKRWIKRNDHIVESYELHFENFERFFANAMFAQNQRNDFNKLFRTTKYDYF